ncbi:MAG: T9SS type A sorting domain-containing protein [Flavitalea sp.]
MKNAIILSILILTTTSAAFSQTIYNIKANITVSGAKMPSQCINCIVNISDGVTLTVNQDIYLQNVTFNGGTIAVSDAKMTFWAPGTFNNVKLTFQKNGGLVSSGALAITNSTFTFYDNTTAVLWSTVDMVATSFKFLGNSNFVATSTVNLSKNSSITAGDGSADSKAFIKFDGGTLNENDKSYVSLLGVNNYYFNWSNYNAAGKSIKTTDSKINCGTGKNSCSAPVVYGLATLNASGVSTNATLPVKLSAFAVKVEGSSVNITWTTDAEINSSRFDIERSTDGNTWVKIGAVTANTNSSVVEKYAYTDLLKTSGTVSYRLKMVDQDETFEYSPIKAVKTAASIEMNIYPNPATDYVVINAKNTTDKMNIQLISFNGQVVKQINGNGTVRMDVNDVHMGNYIVKIVDTTGAMKSFKLMIAK